MPERPIELRPVRRLSVPANHPLQRRIASRIKSHPLGWISGDSHRDAECIVAHFDRKYLAVCEVWDRTFSSIPTLPSVEIDLHDVAAGKSRHPESHRQAVSQVPLSVRRSTAKDRSWKSYTTAYRLQIVYAISNGLARSRPALSGDFRGVLQDRELSGDRWR